MRYRALVVQEITTSYTFGGSRTSQGKPGMGGSLRWLNAQDRYCFGPGEAALMLEDGQHLKIIIKSLEEGTFIVSGGFQ